MATVVILNTNQMGHGEARLGRKILGTCLRKLVSMPDLSAIVLYNAGVKLATKDSPVAIELRQLHEQGVDLLPCGTCLEYYGLQEQIIVEQPSSMDDILACLGGADKVITL